MLPDHEIWTELEKYFRTSISNHERKMIVGIVREAMSENPDVDLDNLTLKAVELIIKRRPAKFQSRFDAENP